MKNKLIAGTSIIDITPAKGAELAGYPHFPRNNEGAHDPLFASCLYLSDGKNSIALVGMDILFFSKKHVDIVRQRVAEKTDIPRHNIHIMCSHSHSTPWASGRLDMESLLAGVKQDPVLITELCDKLVFLIVAAYRNGFKAEIGYNTCVCGRENNIGGNRRDPENGACDPNVYTIAVKDEKGTVRGIFVNYAVHPTLLHEDNLLCSADYPGYIRAKLREAFPHANMIFSLGAAGDQSTRYFREGQSFGEAKRYGYTLGQAAICAVEKMEFSGEAEISSCYVPLDLKLRTLPGRQQAEEHVRLKKQAYDRLVAESATYLEIQNANVALLGAEDILGYVLMEEKGLMPELVTDELPAEASLVRIGDIAVAALPGEVFMGIADRIRQALALDNLVISTVTNGVLPGYAYTPEDGMLGGYEVDTSMLGPEAGDEIVEKIKQMAENNN